MPHPTKTRRWMAIAFIALLANVAMATAVIAGHRFTDVPTGDIFHDDITWLADNDITRGCNPPANSLFCPDDNVTREQMAAFLHRFAGAFGTVGDWTDSGTLIPVPVSGARAEVLSVTVAPESDAVVVLNGTVTFTKTGTSSASYQVLIVRDTCNGELLNHGTLWTSADTDLERMTLPVNAMDTVSGPTTYKVCISGTNPSTNVSRSSVTASWMPAQ